MAPPTDWWDQLYRTTAVDRLPWYSPTLDPDVAAALRVHSPASRRILDLGTGPATQAMELARLGYDVIATDIAAAAIEKGEVAARQAGIRIDFRVDNILRSKLEAGLVDAIVDRGVFHVLPPETRPVYVDTVARVLRPRGLLFLKTFSDEEPGDDGPYRLSPAELRHHFQDSFEILSLERTRFRGARGSGAEALFAVLRRHG